MKANKSIELSEDQQKHYNVAYKLSLDIEREMATVINHDNPAEIQQQITTLLPYLSNVPLMMATATAVYDWAKGQAAEEALVSDNILNAKSDIQRKWFDGKLAKYSAFYKRIETIDKALRQQIEGLRSLLSYQKELANIEKLGGEA